MAAVLLRLPSPPQPPPLRPLRRSSSHSPKKISPLSSPFLMTAAFCPFASPRELLPVIAESSSTSDDGIVLELDSVDGIEGTSDFRGCKACGRKEIERGCNGEGRIQGGIATAPGFGWWPIKAFRPCPGFVESGGRYRRRGQSMDEIAFGRADSRDSAKSKARPSKKAQGTRKFKG